MRYKNDKKNVFEFLNTNEIVLYRIRFIGIFAE